MGVIPPHYSLDDEVKFIHGTIGRHLEGSDHFGFHVHELDAKGECVGHFDFDECCNDK